MLKKSKEKGKREDKKTLKAEKKGKGKRKSKEYKSPIVVRERDSNLD